MKTIITGTIIFPDNDTAIIRYIANIVSVHESFLESRLNEIDSNGIDYIVVEEYEGSITYDKEDIKV